MTPGIPTVIKVELQLESISLCDSQGPLVDFVYFHINLSIMEHLNEWTIA